MTTSGNYLAGPAEYAGDLGDGGLLAAGDDHLVVAGKFFHDFFSLVVVEEGGVAGVGSGELDVFFELAGDDGDPVKGRVDLGEDHVAGREFAVDHVGLLVDDGEDFGYHFPPGAKASGREAGVAAVDAQGVVLRGGNGRKVVDLFMVDRCFADQEGVYVGHHDRLAQGLVEDVGADECEGVALAAPDDAVFLEEHVPDQAGRRVGVHGLVEAVGADAVYAAELVDDFADGEIETGYVKFVLFCDAFAGDVPGSEFVKGLLGVKLSGALIYCFPALVD